MTTYLFVINRLLVICLLLIAELDLRAKLEGNLYNRTVTTYLFVINRVLVICLLLIAELDLSARGIEQWIPKVFIDPGGRHSIFTVCSSATADTYYLHGKWRKPRMFSRLKGLTVSSVGWNRAQINEGIANHCFALQLSFEQFH